MSSDARIAWNNEAATFDDAPDHGLRDLTTRVAWRDLLVSLLPSDQTVDVADLGCGTGTLSILLAEEGHAVRGVDFAAGMLDIARMKAAALVPGPTFTEGDVADPPLPDASFDVVLSRHVLWTMPDPAIALRNWRRLLRPGGRIVLVEGKWSTGAGLTVDECISLVLPLGGEPETRILSNPSLWGGPIIDERYVLITTPTARAAR